MGNVYLWILMWQQPTLNWVRFGTLIKFHLIKSLANYGGLENETLGTSVYTRFKMFERLLSPQ